MWIILKYKPKELQNLKFEIKKLLNEKPFYCIPKIKIKKKNNTESKEKITEKFILGDYLLCFSQKFKKKFIFNRLKYLRGARYLLENSLYSQIEISKFAKLCRENEVEGFLSSSFFKNVNFDKGIFVSGPFRNVLFEVLSKDNKGLRILLGNFQAVIKTNKVGDYLPA